MSEARFLYTANLVNATVNSGDAEYGGFFVPHDPNHLIRGSDTGAPVGAHPAVKDITTYDSSLVTLAWVLE